MFSSEDNLEIVGDVGGGRPDEGGVGALGGVEHHTPRGGEPEAATGGVVGAARQAARETFRTSDINFIKLTLCFGLSLKYTAKGQISLIKILVGSQNVPLTISIVMTISKFFVKRYILSLWCCVVNVLSDLSPAQS